MVKKKTSGRSQFALRDVRDCARDEEELTHIYHGGARCVTDSMGHATPENRSPLELVVDASEGFIPLWGRDVTLHWRFNEQSLTRFLDPEAVKGFVRELFGEALLEWGPAVPVKFTEAQQPWDFEIVVSSQNDCDAAQRCTLASAFFPDGGQHRLTLYPLLFEQSRQEQIETMAHELGHVFGLRHFFAKTGEAAFPSEIFGTHERFSIMNYGPDSRLTDTDRSDLMVLYSHVWSGRLLEINGTPVELMRPFSETRISRRPEAVAAWVREPAAQA